MPPINHLISRALSICKASHTEQGHLYRELRKLTCWQNQCIMAHTEIPDALSKIEAREKDVPWYSPEIGNQRGDSARELLENYSKIPAAEVEDNVYKIVRLFPRTVKDS